MAQAPRIGDADRERAADELARHYAEGRLQYDEYAERLDAAWTARTMADVWILFEDLPRPVRDPVTPRARSAGAPPSVGAPRRLALWLTIAAVVALAVLTRIPVVVLILVTFVCVYGVRGRTPGRRANTTGNHPTWRHR